MNCKGKDKYETMTTHQLQNELSYFTGSGHATRYMKGFEFFLSDGALFLCREAQCFWLIDLILFAQAKERVRSEAFQVWRFIRQDGKCEVTVDDGNGNILERYPIGYSDFPLDEFKVWFENRLVHLPSER
jgi:hypothetical protein